MKRIALATFVLSAFLSFTTTTCVARAEPTIADESDMRGKPGADIAAEDRAAVREAAARPISVAPLAGFGTGELGLGFGLRAGYTIPSSRASGGGVYFGAAFVYHAGSSVRSELGGTSISAYYPAMEAGYDLRFDRVVIRPYGGVGLVLMSSTTKTALEQTSAATKSLGFYPGCAITYDFPGSSVFAGGDTRLLVAAEGNSVSFGIFGTGGFRF